MSKTVSNPEVDDVLSSIRRLVSQEGRGRRDLASSGPDTVRNNRSGADGPLSGKLVLTPALRVPTYQTEPQRPAHGRAGHEAVSAEEIAAPSFEDGTDDARPPVEEGRSSALPVLPLDQTVRLPDHDELSDTRSAEPQTDTGAATQSAPSLDADELVFLGESHPKTDRIGQDRSLNGPLKAKIAALEAAISKRDGKVRENQIVADRAALHAGSVESGAGNVPPSEQDIPYRLKPDARQDGEVPDDPDPEVSAEGFDQVRVIDHLDEETLRRVVSDIVREELQGKLGERITRNVRKLVRQEILRTLAARDIE